MRSDRYKNIPWYKQFWGIVIIVAFVIGISGIIITAIFDGRSTKSSNTTTSDTNKITDISKPRGSFDGHTAKLPKYTIKIRKVSIGENNDGDKCIVFDYTAYNKSAKKLTASDAWEQTFDVCQPDKNTQNQLVDEVDIPDSISDEMEQEINKGGHARGEYIAILKSTKRPVVLKAHNDSGNSIGEHKYKFKIKASSKNASSKGTTSNDDKQEATGNEGSNGGSSTAASDTDSSSKSSDKKDDDKVVINGHSFHHQNFNDGDSNYDILVGDNGEGELGEWGANDPAVQQSPDLQSQIVSAYNPQQ